MTLRWFVTGTDTGIGKTFVTAALLHAARDRGLRAIGMKPVASGCIDTPDGLRSEDALELIDAMSHPPPAYERVNPYALREPLSPHIAANRANVAVDFAKIRSSYDILAKEAEFLLVEGVGGWCVPITDDVMQAALVRMLELPVVLVVSIKLGCINHSLLSARAIEADGCRLAGWIANRSDPSLVAVDEAIDTIARHLGAPLGSIDLGGPCPPALLDRLVATQALPE
jgi:dethiobiotin synthetase